MAPRVQLVEANACMMHQQKQNFVQMKVVIQNILTKAYVKSSKRWTDEPDEAKNFEYFELAAQFVRQKNLHDVQFAVPMPESKEVLVFPVVRL